MNVETYERIKNELSGIVSQIDFDKPTPQEKVNALLDSSRIVVKILTYIGECLNEYKTDMDRIKLFYIFDEQLEYAIKKYKDNEVYFSTVLKPEQYRSLYKRFLKHLCEYSLRNKKEFNGIFEKKDIDNNVIIDEDKIDKYINECDYILVLSTIVSSLGSPELKEKFSERRDLCQKKLDREAQERKENIDLKIIDNDEALKENETIRMEQERTEQLRKELAEQEAKEAKLKEERKEKLFGDASKELAIDKEVLIDKVGENNIHDIDNIQISSDLLEELKSEDRLVCTLPKTFLDKIGERVSKKRLINSLVFDVEKIDNIKVLKISKKDTFFDKIASGKRPIMEAVINSAQRKFFLLKSWVGIDVDLVNKIKQSMEEKYDTLKERDRRMIEGEREVLPKPEVVTTSKTIFSIDGADVKKEDKEATSIHDRLVKFIEESQDGYEDVYSYSSDDSPKASNNDQGEIVLDKGGEVISIAHDANKGNSAPTTPFIRKNTSENESDVKKIDEGEKIPHRPFNPPKFVIGEVDGDAKEDNNDQTIPIAVPFIRKNTFIENDVKKNEKVKAPHRPFNPPEFVDDDELVNSEEDFPVVSEKKPQEMSKK